MASPLPADAIRRIVCLRANGLGDFLFVTPALRALARAFPWAEITYLCQPWMRAFVDRRYPYIHRTMVVPPYPGIRPPDRADRRATEEAEAFFRRCQELHFDVAIQMHGGGVQSNPFVRRLGAKVTLGLTGRDVSPLDRNVPYQFYQHEVLRYLELVRELGVVPDGLEMDAPELPGDAARLQLAWPEVVAGTYVVVHVGASDPRRRWPVERYAAVADYVQRTYRRPVVATGSLGERHLVGALRAAASLPIVDLAGQLDLGALLALVRRARLVISNDTGVANLAYAVTTPSVVVYWCGNVITAGPLFRRHFRPVLSWTLACPACGKRACRCPVSFVQDAPLDEVVDHVDDLLGETRVAPGHS